MFLIPHFFLKHACTAHLYSLYRSHFGSRYTFGPMRSSQAFLGSNPSSFISYFSFYYFLFLPLFRPQGVLGLTQVPCSCSQNCLGTPRLHSSCQRPYRVECTGSLPNSEVKRRRARSVPGWGTAREALRVLLAFIIILVTITLICDSGQKHKIVIAFMHTFSGWHFHTFPSVNT